MEVDAITVIYCGNGKYPGDCNYLKVPRQQDRTNKRRMRQAGVR